jgi:glucose-1-phosphate adenylyltransferase
MGEAQDSLFSRGVPRLAERSFAVVMAGGNGSRLGHLTRWHSKPALPFGGCFRNIDFPLSNCVNSGIRRIAVATQYKAQSLIQHVSAAWNFLPREIGEFVDVWPAQQRCGKNWYSGTADSIYQNLDLLDVNAPEYVLVLAGDHVYKMDYLEMLESHVASGAPATLACIDVPIDGASEFGIVDLDADGWLTRFDEKPGQPQHKEGDPRHALASMGIYIFSYRALCSMLDADARNPNSLHDFGHDVLPQTLRQGGIHAFEFQRAPGGAPAYWRDIGTLDSYWQANMDLLAERPPLDLNDRAWPIWTSPPRGGPARFCGYGSAQKSIVSGGCRIEGRVEFSMLSPGCTVGDGAVVTDSVLLPNVHIGRNCRIQGAIVDSDTSIPDGTVIGADRQVGCEQSTVTPGGVVLVSADSFAAEDAGMNLLVA